MKKAKEILDRFKLDIDSYDYSCVIQAMTEYAKLAIEEQLLIVEDEAHCENSYEDISKESIRNCTRVELK